MPKTSWNMWFLVYMEQTWVHSEQHTADGMPSFYLWSGSNEMCMIWLVWSQIFFSFGGSKFVCAYFHQNWEDHLLWYTFFGVGWVFQPPEVLFYLMLKQGQLVGRPSSSHMQNAKPQWCFSSVWVWEALLPLPWLFTLSQINIYDSWKGKRMFPTRHKLMLVDGSMERCLGSWSLTLIFFLDFFPQNLRTFEDVVYVKTTSHFRMSEESSEAISFKIGEAVKTRWI